MAGNPNPSPATRFKPGNNANPGGKSPEHARHERESAAMAAKLRHAALSAMTEKAESGADVSEMINSDALKLFKDSEDRAHGTPKQAIEHTGEGGGPIRSLNVTGLSDAALAEILAAIHADPDANG